MAIDQRDIRDAIRRGELAGKAVCIHSSLKSFGELDDGARSVIEAFAKEGCTILVPTFTYDFELPPPEGVRVDRNGYDDVASVGSERPRRDCYTPDSREVEVSMGAIPATLLTMEGRRRGVHPLNSFAALGPKAAELVAGQTEENVYAPFEWMERHGGVLVLMGVGLTRATAIHYAEWLAGRNLFIRWARNRWGEIVPVRTGSCSEGFDRLQPFVQGIERSRIVGRSVWRYYDIKAFVETVRSAIVRDPTITRCGDTECLRCRDAVLGGPTMVE